LQRDPVEPLVAERVGDAQPVILLDGADRGRREDAPSTGTDGASLSTGSVVLDRGGVTVGRSAESPQAEGVVIGRGEDFYTEIERT
jgi:hypothetical protein